MELFENFLKTKKEDDVKKEFEKALNLEFDLTSTLQDVLDSISHFKSEDNFSYKSGIFLSAFAFKKNCDDVIKVENGIQIDYFGSFLKSNQITVKGDLGNFTAAFLDGGTLLIEGSIGDNGGYAMNKGQIWVKGKAGNHLCHFMRSGEVIVDKNALDFVGNSMVGGTIEIKGSSGYSLGYRMVGGEIEVKDLSWDLIGEEMVGGKITVRGHIGKELCQNMVGGIVLLNEEYKDTPRGKISGGKIVFMNFRKR